MKKLNTSAAIILGLFLCCLSFGCGEDDDNALPAYCIDNPNLWPDCPNYDPCFRVVPVISAEWDMVDTNHIRTDSAIAFVIDTAWNQRVAPTFRPRVIQDRVIYRWQLGTDPRIYETAFFTPPQGFFSNYEGPIDVTLEVEQLDTVGCLTLAETIKSVTKTVHFIDRRGSDFPVLGQYRGNYEDADGNVIQEGVEMEMNLIGDDFLFNLHLFGADLPGDCNYINETGIPFTGSFYQMVSRIRVVSTQCPMSIRPVLLLDLDPQTATQLTVDIWYDDPDTEERVYKKFVGERI